MLIPRLPAAQSCREGARGGRVPDVALVELGPHRGWGPRVPPAKHSSPSPPFVNIPPSQLSLDQEYKYSVFVFVLFFSLPAVKLLGQPWEPCVEMKYGFAELQSPPD